MKIKYTQNVKIEFEKVFPFLFSLIILTGFLIRYSFIGHESLWPDEALYLFIAKNLSLNPLKIIDESGKTFFKNPPLFMYLLSFVFRLIGGTSIKIAHLVTVLMDTGTIILIGYIGSCLYNKKVGLLSAALLAVNPLHVWISTRILTDVPLVFFIYLSLYFLIRQKDAFFYLFSFLSVATKYPAAPIFVLPFINKKTISNSPRSWLIIYLLVISVIICMISFRFNIQNHWMSYFTGFIGLPDFKEIYKESIFFIDPVVCILFLIGVGTALKHKDFSPILMWVIIFGTARFFLPWVAFRVSRYSLPLYPAVLMFAAYGGLTSFSFLKEKMLDRTILLTLVFSSILVYVIAIYSIRGYAVTDINNQTFVGYKEAGAFLTKQNGEESILTASPRQIKYYAPEFTVYDLAKHITFKESRELIIEKEIGFISIDRWSPHQPSWCRDNSRLQNYYRPVYKNEDIIIFKIRRD
ncbi:MAG: glycosyltransferase family 39 protein [Deltaproteobacteria bacterium]|nr:glycosyltransferase family 39 protein [Deltaproteobacteria bacterium]